jgi:hypothetical protein
VLNITITNYADELHVTFIALREALPDVQVLADATARALVELQHSLARHGTTARIKPPQGARATLRRGSRPVGQAKRKTAAPPAP